MLLILKIYKVKVDVPSTSKLKKIKLHHFYSFAIRCRIPNSFSSYRIRCGCRRERWWLVDICISLISVPVQYDPICTSMWPTISYSALKMYHAIILSPTSTIEGGKRRTMQTNNYRELAKDSENKIYLGQELTGTSLLYISLSLDSVEQPAI